MVKMILTALTHMEWEGVIQDVNRWEPFRIIYTTGEDSCNYLHPAFQGIYHIFKCEFCYKVNIVYFC